jgi:acylphosphatase
VQGVFFRACTAEEAQKLGIVGWVKNTSRGTVEGDAQGERNKLDAFKVW